MEPISERLKDAIGKCMSFQRHCMDGDPTSMPHAFIIDAKGETTVIAFANDCMENGATKEKVAREILVKMFTYEAVSAFCSDAWRAKLPKGKTRADMPPSLSAWPPELREEFIFCCGNEIGRVGIVVNQSYHRDSNDKLTWGPVEWPENDTIGTGRFIFDLRDSNPTVPLMRMLRKTYKTYLEGMDDASNPV